MRPARLRPLPLLWLLSALVPALVPAPAHAALITGYAVGQVTQNLSTSTTTHQFPVGTLLTQVIFRYDVEAEAADVSFSTSTGYADHLFVTRITPASDKDVVASGSGVFLFLAQGPRTLTLRLAGDVGTLEYSRDLGSPTAGFRASLARASGPEAFPAPEPSGLVLGVTGAALAGLYRWRRRAAA